MSDQDRRGTAYRKRRAAAAAAAAAWLATWTGAATATAADVGMNMLFNNDWQTAAPWADVTKMFRTWGQPDQPWVANPSLQLTSDGYPLQSAGTMTSLASYPDGVYKLSYTGTATVQFGWMGTITNLVHNGNTTTADVIVDRSKASKLSMTVTGLDPANPLRDVHLMVPGARPGQVFTDEFVRRLQPFSTIRMMDWGMINNSMVSSWSQRTTPQSFIQTGPAGVALEYQVALGNQAGKNPWVNVPTLADDDYVRNMARTIHQELAPGRTVYVEYGNELWNARFGQYGQNLANAKANPALTATDDFGRAAQQEAFRTKQIGDIFRQEFGADASRVKVVLAGQAASNAFLPQAMKYLQTTYGSASRYVDEIAIAPYVNIPPSADTAGLTLDGLFQALNTELDTNVSKWIKNAATVATQYGVPLVAYEGGQGLIPLVNGTVVNQDLKAQAERDPRMGALVAKLVNLWGASGGSLYNEYGFVQGGGDFGYWGALENLTDPGSPRWDALMRLTHPLGDADLNGGVDEADLRILMSHYGQLGMWWEQGDFTGDGRVNADDLAILDLALTRRQQIAIATSTVPEPELDALLVGGTAVLGLMRRQRR